MSAPHMTIEEFGDLEVARMAAEEEAKKNAPVQPQV